LNEEVTFTLPTYEFKPTILIDNYGNYDVSLSSTNVIDIKHKISNLQKLIRKDHTAGYFETVILGKVQKWYIDVKKCK